VKTLGRLSSFRSLIVFLTILPVGKASADLSDLGRVWFLSPLVGVLIGAIAGAIGWIASKTLPSLVVGSLAIGLIILITGGHHLDGLLDFGDALMVHGPPERRIEAMHEKALGAGGFALGLFVPILTIASFITLNPNVIIQTLIVSELSAKLSMVAASRFGNASHEGTGSTVVKAMHGTDGNAKLLASIAISLAIAGLLMRYAGLTVVATSIICALLMTAIADHEFRGLTGDVFGATNEIARMISLLTLLAVTR